MLALIEKVASGKVDLSPPELKIAARYFGFMAQHLDLPSIQALWNQLPEETRTPLLPDAVEKNAGLGRADVVRFFLDQAARTPDADACFKQIFQPSGERYPYFESALAWKAVNSGSVETLDLLVQEAQKRNGADYATKMIDAGFFNARHARVFQWMYQQLEERNFPEDVRVRKLDRCISAALTSKAEEQYFHDVLEKLYKLRGSKAIAAVAASAFLEGQGEGFWPHTEPDMLAIVRALPKIGGHDLVRAVIPAYDYALMRRAVTLPSRKIFVELYKICKDTGDEPFFDKMADAITSELFVFRESYQKTILAAVNGHQRFKNCDADLLVDMAVLSWEAKTRRGRFEASHETQDLTSSDPDRAPHEPIISWEKNMAFHATPWDFTLMAILHKHLELPSLHKKLFPDLPDIALRNPRLFRNFMNIIARADGLDGAGEESARIFVALTDRACTAEGDDAWEMHLNCHSALRKIMRYSKRIGQFDKIVTRAAENDFDLLRKLEYFRANDISSAIYDAMDPDLRLKAAEKSYIPWSQLWDKKMTKSEFWRQYAARETRWLMMTGRDAPSYHIQLHSPYRFKPQLYKTLLPLMEQASAMEGAGSAETHAYKLSVLFSTRDEVDRYLNKWATQWAEGNRYIVHDACLFDIPKDPWDAQYWKGVVMKFGPEAFRFLSRAPEIDHVTGFTDAATKITRPPAKLKELEAQLLKMGYKRGEENLPLAKLAGRYGLDEDLFNATLDDWKTYKKTKDFMPDITIKGEDVGAPGVLFQRLAPDDPLGFFLGHMSNCCQKIGDNGEPCVRYGMSSPYSGFYIWVDVAKNALLGQSWAWIDAKDNLVFDSFERHESRGDKIFLPFLEQFAHDVRDIIYGFMEGPTGRLIHEVRLGTKGQTPLLTLSKVTDPQRPVGYTGQYDDGTPALDSLEQYAIPPKNYRALAPEPARNPPTVPLPRKNMTP